MGLILSIVFLVLCIMVGEKKGYNTILCGIAGFLFSWLALIVIALLPDKKKAEEEAAAQAAAQRRKMNEMSARIRELEEQQKNK